MAENNSTDEKRLNKQQIEDLFHQTIGHSDTKQNILVDYSHLDKTLKQINAQIEDNDKRQEIKDKKAQERLDHDEKSHKLKRKRKKQKIDDEAQNIELRKRFASDNFDLVTWYLIVVAFFLFATGVTHFIKIDFLSDNVLITILTTTTINVIGIYLIVLHYLYKPKSSNSSKKSRKQKK